MHQDLVQSFGLGSLKSGETVEEVVRIPKDKQSTENLMRYDTQKMTEFGEGSEFYAT